MKKLLFVGAEAMPFAATGGLGDVLGSLPAALAKSGECDVRVVIPLYETVKEEWRRQMVLEKTFTVQLSWRQQYCGVFNLKKDGVTYYFIDNEYYFKRPSLYGYMDDGERYAYFCMSTMELMGQLNFFPDVLHAHDWQGALAPVYLNCLYRGRKGYENIKTVFTIHNIEYQGHYDFAILGDVFALGNECHELMDNNGCINLMKAAIECCDRVTTVSPRYANEILTPEYAHGLDGILHKNEHKLCGILNGIDLNYYNAKTDKTLACNFSVNSMDGKIGCKESLQKEIGLPVNAELPIVSIISRLASHKGLDLVCEMMNELVANNNLQVVVLGCGEKRFEDFFKDLQNRFPDKVRALIQYDRALSKRIYSATDIFLMPSKSEPCGLSQMIASRYGAIPVVRETGGLYDSIKPYWKEGNKLHGNGFTFAGYTAYELKERTEAALAVWNTPEERKKLVRRIMTVDFSWENSAKQYLELYQNI